MTHNSKNKKELGKALEKQYRKANEKSVKKGNGTLSMVKFLEKEAKYCKPGKYNIYYYIIPPILVLIYIFTNEFDSIYRSLFSLAIGLIIGYLFTYFCWKLNEEANRIRYEYIQEKLKELSDK